MKRLKSKPGIGIISAIGGMLLAFLANQGLLDESEVTNYKKVFNTTEEKILGLRTNIEDVLQELNFLRAMMGERFEVVEDSISNIEKNTSRDPIKRKIRRKRRRKIMRRENPKTAKKTAKTNKIMQEKKKQVIDVEDLKERMKSAEKTGEGEIEEKGFVIPEKKKNDRLNKSKEEYNRLKQEVKDMKRVLRSHNEDIYMHDFLYRRNLEKLKELQKLINNEKKKMNDVKDTVRRQGSAIIDLTSKVGKEKKENEEDEDEDDDDDEEGEGE